MSRQFKGDSGAVLVEYAMLVSLVLLVAFLAVGAFGVSVLDLFRSAVDVWP